MRKQIYRHKFATAIQPSNECDPPLRKAPPSTAAAAHKRFRPHRLKTTRSPHASPLPTPAWHGNSLSRPRSSLSVTRLKMALVVHLHPLKISLFNQVSNHPPLNRSAASYKPQPLQIRDGHSAGLRGSPCSFAGCLLRFSPSGQRRKMTRCWGRFITPPLCRIMAFQN